MIASSARRRLVSALLTGGRRTLRTDERRCLRVLGIETSCDDTAIAIVEDRRILAQIGRTKQHVTNRIGGVSPYVAAEHHRECIDNVLDECVSTARIRLADLDAIAVTRGPGTVICLKVGVDKALALCRSFHQPLIPVHHMRAHALTARLSHKDVHFPYLCFLMSGGHCLLTLIKGAEDFVLLGQSTNSSSPGEATDKIARHLRLWDIPELASTSGGHAVEILASRAPPGGHLRYPPTRISRINHRDCDFDFHHFKAYYLRYIDRHGRPSDSALEMFCASFQHNIFKHMALRLQRCIEILDEKEMVPIGGRTLVLSGGVARNAFYRKGLAFVAAQYDYRLVCPPPVLCSDNGVMIAWTGVELLEKRSNVIINRSNLPHALYVDDRLPIGDDVRDDFKEMHWKVQTKIDLDDIDAFMLSGDLDDESAKRVQM